jgi:NADP-dependent 3-hydroxy acid dehydrogenase YdfG
MWMIAAGWRARVAALAAAGAHVIDVARTEADLESLAEDYPDAIEPWLGGQ